MKKNIANFTAGPSMLPAEVEERLREATHDFLGTGIPIWSISHRHPKVENTLTKTILLVRDLLKIPPGGYSILFAPGGATSQFKVWPQNMPPRSYGRNMRIYYVDSGYWSHAAIRAGRDLEQAGLCSIEAPTPSEYEDHRMMPDVWRCLCHADGHFDFFHITTNETANGTQLNFREIPRHSCDVVADMSSDIMSRPFDVSQFAYIYAGAQKNLGIAGTTLIIIRNDLLRPNVPHLPAPLVPIEQIGARGGLRNTPDILALYGVNLMLQWIEKEGGLPEMERRSRVRASLLYRAIDESGVFEGIAEKESRSLMNVTFRLKDQNRHTAFLKLCDKAGIVGIDGHKGVSCLYGPHCRASLYNAQTMENVIRLVDVMKEFERTV